MFGRAASVSVFLVLVVGWLVSAAVGPVPQGPLPAGALARLGEVRFRHLGEVSSLAFSPDGKVLASGGYDGTVCLWDAATGWPLRRLDGKQAVVQSVAYSADGKLLASAGRGHPERVCLFDTGTGRLVGELDGAPAYHVTALLFSPNGRYLVAGSFERGLSLWDVPARKRLRTWKTDLGDQWPVRFTADSGTLITGSRGRALRRWDVATGRELSVVKDELHVPPGVSTWPNKMAVTPDGKALAQIGTAETSGDLVELWNARSGKVERRRFVVKGKTVTALALTPDGKVVAAGDMDGGMRIWDTKTGQRVGPSAPHRRVAHVYFAPDGKPMAVGIEEGAVCFWDVRTGFRVRRLLATKGKVYASSWLCFSPDGKWLAAVGHEDLLNRDEPPADEKNPTVIWESVRLWRLDTGREVHAWRNKVRPLVLSLNRRSALMFSPDSKRFASLGLVGEFTVREVETGKLLHQFPREKDKDSDGLWFNQLSWSPDSKRLWVFGYVPPYSLFGGGNNPRNGLRVLDLMTGKLSREKGKPDKDGRRCAEGGVAVHDLRSQGDLLVQGWQRSADGRVVAVWDARGVYFVDCATGKPLHDNRIESPRFGPLTVAFSPSSRLFALADTVGRVHVYEVATGGEIGQFFGHYGDIGALAFSPGGKTLLSGSEDGTAIVWDVSAAAGRVSHAEKLSPERLAALWGELLKVEAGPAHRAVWELVAAGREATPFLLRSLGPVEVIEPKRLDRLLKGLGADEFAEREKATEELARLGFAVEAALRKLREKPPDLEVERRADRLLKALKGRSSGVYQLRAGRALEALEQIGTAEARAALKVLVERGPWLEMRREAQAGLRRLESREKGR